MRFGSGFENPGLSPSFRDESLFRWTEVQLTLAEEGGSHQIRRGYIGGSFSGSHAGAKALTILVGVPRLKSCPDTGRECGHLSLQLAAGVQLISHRNAPGFVYAVGQQDELRRCVGRRHQRCRGIAQRN